jgi:hypothetical protein
MRYYLYAAVVGAVLFFAAYKDSTEIPVEKHGLTLMQSFVVERVRGDLTEIASAENENITVHSVCLDLDDLVTSKTYDRLRTERGGYSYAIRCNQQEFVVSATPPPEPFGAKYHKPVITVDEHLEVREEQ